MNERIERTFRTYPIALFLLYILIQGAQTTFAQSEKTAVQGQNPNIEYYRDLGATPKVADLMRQMTLQEKIGQLNLLTPGGTVTGEVVSKDVEAKIAKGQVGGIFGIRGADKVRRAQEIAVKKSRLGIPLLIGLDVIHGHQTIFPIPLGLSCSWDLELIKKSARIAAREATADGIMWAFSPMVDIARDPRWGRIAEGSGEDPFLGSEIAKAMVRGYQGIELHDSTTLMACVKHFALYGAPEGGRDYGTVDMSRVRMMNEYMPPFKAAVDAGVGSVMTGFNVYDYVPVTASNYLLQDVLREAWNFQGLIVSDYTSINEMTEHGIGDLKEVSKKAINAGLDMDMVGEGFLTTLEKSLEENTVSMETIDRACIRVLKAKEKLGILDNPYLYYDVKRAEKEILSPENRAFARAAAAASCVLLKNENRLLPLRNDMNIAVVGPLADSRINMLGTWAVSGDYKEAVTVVEGIRKKVSTSGGMVYAKGANIADDKKFAERVNAFGEEISIDKRSPSEMIEEALHISSEADVIIVVVGEAANMTGEASSMTQISLQESQKKLLTALKSSGKPIVMVLFNGRPMVIVDEMKDMDAVLDVWFGGTEAGNAIADVLFGDVVPSGKLTTSFPVNEGQIPVYHSMLNTGRPDQGTRVKFRSNYLDAPNEPLLPFGYGLSYTSFSYGKPQLSSDILRFGEEITARIEITNRGDVAGHEIVQLYLRDMVARISRPVMELKGFEKIFLEPGEMKVVEFKIDADLLKFYNDKLNYGVEPGEFHLMIGRNSADVQSVSFRLE